MLTHDVFYNRERPGKDELDSYLPKFWRGIREMQANNAFAGYTLDRMAEDMEQTVRDRFFDSCSEAMILRYERFLQIYDTQGMSIEDRRLQVKMKWNGAGKMTGSRIKAIVKECCGSDCDVSFGSSQLMIEFVLGDNPTKYIGMIREIIENSTIPAHIEVIFKINMDLNIIFNWKNDIEMPKMAVRTELPISHELLQAKTLSNAVCLQQKEEFDFSVTVKKNLHYFDGSLCWDGSTLMNAGIKKEEL